MKRVVGEPQHLAPQSEIAGRLDKLLKAYVAALQARISPRLLAFVQFGSTVRGSIRTETDIDLLIVFDSVPADRIERQRLVAPIEQALEPELVQLGALGYHLQFSSMIKSADEFRRFSPVYLDMTAHAVVHFSRDGIAEEVLARTKAWMQRHAITRREHGLKWYWIEERRSGRGFDTSDW
jgi:predicted nucleotidyltransferase